MTKKTTCIYFSASGLTEQVVKTIAAGLGTTEAEYTNLLLHPDTSLTLPADGLAIVGMPVYAGRIPAPAADMLRRIKGEHTPAIIVAVYGNRAFEDALVEMQDLLTAGGFEVMAAGAFVAQHSIFPRVAQGRPDQHDRIRMREFAEHCAEVVSRNAYRQLPPLPLPGNRPYREAKAIPLIPSAGRKCTGCGLCARECPTGAISPQHPKRTDQTKCISCTHCISICPHRARCFGGLLYPFVARQFEKKLSARQEAYVAYRE